VSYDLATFPFGQSAVVAPADRADFEALKSSLLAELNPFTYLQAVLVDELLHASWELARARKYGAPQPFVDRATRNWHRSRNALSRLHTAYSAGLNTLEGEDSDACVAAPLANPLVVAKRRKSSAAHKWLLADNQKKLQEMKVQ
jgi:hypothetical protein